MEKLVKILKERRETISSMESCTGGFFASEITNISGSSEVLKCSLITYCDEFKIKFGVDKEIIAKYGVYSQETSIAMAKNVTKFTGATWGIGITGKIGLIDSNNCETNNEVYYTIFNSVTLKCYNFKLNLKNNDSRLNKKKVIVNDIIKNMHKILNSNI